MLRHFSQEVQSFDITTFFFLFFFANEDHFLELFSQNFVKPKPVKLESPVTNAASVGMNQVLSLDMARGQSSDMQQRKRAKRRA